MLEKDELGNYKETTAGYIIDVAPSYMNLAKEAVLAAKDHSDKVYIYPGNFEVPISKGISCGHLLNLKSGVANLGRSIKESIMAVSREEDEKKFLFVITDRANFFDEYKCMRALAFDKDKEVDVRFLCLGDSFEEFNLDSANKVQTTKETLAKDIVSVLNPDYIWPEVEEVAPEPVVKQEPKKKKKKPEVEIRPLKISMEDLNDE